MKRLFSAPTSINVEITDKCNASCRHCYNFWRIENRKNQSMTIKKMDELVEHLKEAQVFHAVLSGGEPFAMFDLLEYGLKRLNENNISVSCNSNLMMASEDKIKRLADAGLDHILTSLNSYNPEKNDYLVNQKGAFRRIVRGIETAVNNGIRISVNMIISQYNKDDVYDTGSFINNLGCQKLFGTRLVPPVSKSQIDEAYIKIDQQDALQTLNQLVEVKKDTGMMIGTLISYPLCLLGDLEKFEDFVGRGCPAQAGHRMSINANGEAHACVHEEKSYGNIFKIGIAAA